MDVNERCEMYRRQLGGANAANNRKSAKIRELTEKLDEQGARTASLEALVRDMWDALIANHGGYVTVMTLEKFEERMKALDIKEAR